MSGAKNIFAIIAIFVISFSSFSSKVVAGNELLSVSVIFRHGDKTIDVLYPNDPYKSEVYWPEGFGQLTNKGKLQQFELGQWLQQRYGDFMQNLSVTDDIYVFSTDKDRTLMSAESTLAGLFPPTGDKVWHPDLQWQPIPIHTIPMTMDNILTMKKSCPRFDNLYEDFNNSPFILKIQEQNRELYSYLTSKSGKRVKDMVAVEFLYNTLLIEYNKNYTLPSWTRQVFPSSLEPIASFSYALPTFTTEMARLRVGPFMNQVASQFEAGGKNSTKVLLFSAHDTTIAHILNSLGLFEYHCPPYSATIMFELRKISGMHFVNILYKNGSVVHKMSLKKCAFNCQLQDFLNIVRPIRLTPDEWEDKCISLEIESQASIFGSNAFIISLIIGMMLTSGIFAVLINRRVNLHKRYNDLPTEYIEL